LNQKVFQSLKKISPVITAHGHGKKFVFLAQHDTQTSLTQFAYGLLMPGESIARHCHPTMEECFYFIAGKGKYIIDNIYTLLNQTAFLEFLQILSIL
jgi:quercetin dioxygenase-like cupin family protein